MVIKIFCWNICSKLSYDAKTRKDTVESGSNVMYTKVLIRKASKYDMTLLYFGTRLRFYWTSCKVILLTAGVPSFFCCNCRTNGTHYGTTGCWYCCELWALRLCNTGRGKTPWWSIFYGTSAIKRLYYTKTQKHKLKRGFGYSRRDFTDYVSCSGMQQKLTSGTVNV